MSMVRPARTLFVCVALLFFGTGYLNAGDPMPKPTPLPHLFLEFDPYEAGGLTIADGAKIEISNFGCWDSTMDLVNPGESERFATVGVRVLDLDGALQAAFTVLSGFPVPANSVTPVETDGCDHGLGLAFPSLTEYRIHRSLSVH